MKFLKVVAIIFFIFAGIMFYNGHDKMTNYYNSEYNILNHNAYVGGDAYNYIINGTYATSYFVLGTGGLIAGVMCIGISIIGEKICATNNTVEKVTEIGVHENVDKLERLVRIREAGLITEKEYQMVKNRFLSPEEMLHVVKLKYDAGEISEQQYVEAKVKILSRL